MFDTIIYKDKEYQTKDIECTLSKFLLEDGRLYKLIYDWQDEDRVNLCGQIDMEYDGDFDFYSDDKSIEASFKKGQLMKLTW